MTNLDWLCAAVIFVFGLLGFRRGLIGEFFRVAALVLGLVAGFSLSGRMAAWLAGFMPGLAGTPLRITAFIFLLVAGAGAVALVGRMVTKVVRLTILGWLDRLGGVLIGGLKGILIVGLLIWAISWLPSLQMLRSPDHTRIAHRSVKVISWLWQAGHGKESFVPAASPAIPSGGMEDSLERGAFQ
jgi:membrane protein required for colicin V production